MEQIQGKIFLLVVFMITWERVYPVFTAKIEHEKDLLRIILQWQIFERKQFQMFKLSIKDCYVQGISLSPVYTFPHFLITQKLEK